MIFDWNLNWSPLAVLFSYEWIIGTMHGLPRFHFASLPLLTPDAHYTWGHTLVA